MIEDANLFLYFISRPKCFVNEAIQEARVLFLIKFIQVLTPQILLLNLYKINLKKLKIIIFLVS